jgi:hypothetical protein
MNLGCIVHTIVFVTSDTLLSTRRCEYGCGLQSRFKTFSGSRYHHCECLADHPVTVSRVDVLLIIAIVLVPPNKPTGWSVFQILFLATTGWRPRLSTRNYHVSLLARGGTDADRFATGLCLEKRYTSKRLGGRSSTTVGSDRSMVREMDSLRR